MKKLLPLILIFVLLFSACGDKLQATSCKLQGDEGYGEELQASPTSNLQPPTSTTTLQAPTPTPYPEGTRIIYLTFDDGPSEHTDALLNTLSENNVKATFFVTGDAPDYYDCIGREFAEGHSVGIHCMHHKDYKMYNTYDGYWEDFNAIDELIFSQTGEHTDIMRFPGGSSNWRSDQNSGMMTYLAYKVQDKGYTYFDWDASSGDTERNLTAEAAFEEMKRQVENCREYAILLNHDTMETTVEAMEQFIPWALENGFAFEPLTPDCPTAHHMIHN